MSKTEMPEIINIRGQIHARTERDILFSTDGDQESAVWLPLARIEIGPLAHGVGIVTMPADLAEQRGLS